LERIADTHSTRNPIAANGQKQPLREAVNYA